MYIRALMTGALTLIPGAAKLLRKHGSFTGSASYCYGVWLKHLSILSKHGMERIPASLAEIGPGDSLGVGLAAMLCGVDHYHALDIGRLSDTATNLRVLSELQTLLERRAPRPSKGWPDYDAYLDSNLFPSHILTERLLERTLSAERVQAIRQALCGSSASPGEVTIRYTVPWTPETIENDSVELLMSHAVMQSVPDLESTYTAFYNWLAPGGFMSHQVDFSSFNTSRQWNGQWTYSDNTWKTILARRPYLINRLPHSAHTTVIRNSGFDIVCDLQLRGSTPGIERAQLAPRWRDMSDDDMSCSGAFLQARKPHRRDRQHR